MMFKYIWCEKNIYREDDFKNIVEKVGRCTMEKNYDEGRLRMIDITQMQISIALKWITKINESGNGIWKAIPRYYFNKFGPNLLVFKMDTHFKQIKGFGRYFPPHYKALIEMWCNIPNKNIKQSLKSISQVLWNNRNYTYRGNVIFNMRWIRNDIIFLGDMINHNKICNIEEVTEKIGNIALSQLEYNVVRNAIPLHVLNQTICKKRDFTIYLDNRPLKHMTTKQIREVIRTKKH